MNHPSRKRTGLAALVLGLGIALAGAPAGPALATGGDVAPPPVGPPTCC